MERLKQSSGYSSPPCTQEFFFATLGVHLPLPRGILVGAQPLSPEDLPSSHRRGTAGSGGRGTLSPSTARPRPRKGLNNPSASLGPPGHSPRPVKPARTAHEGAAQGEREGRGLPKAAPPAALPGSGHPTSACGTLASLPPCAPGTALASNNGPPAAARASCSATNAAPGPVPPRPAARRPSLPRPSPPTPPKSLELSPGARNKLSVPGCLCRRCPQGPPPASTRQTPLPSEPPKSPQTTSPCPFPGTAP